MFRPRNELPEANRVARGQHVANLLAFQPDSPDIKQMSARDLGCGVQASRVGAMMRAEILVKQGEDFIVDDATETRYQLRL